MDFSPGVMHGASAAQTRYSFSGIKVSSPVLTTTGNVFHISSQSDRGANNRGQSIRVRYLPRAALELVRRPRFVIVSLLLLLRFLSVAVANTVLWSDSPTGGKACGAA